MRYFYIVINIIVTKIMDDLNVGILSKHVDFKLTFLCLHNVLT